MYIHKCNGNAKDKITGYLLHILHKTNE